MAPGGGCRLTGPAGSALTVRAEWRPVALVHMAVVAEANSHGIRRPILEVTDPQSGPGLCAEQTVLSTVSMSPQSHRCMSHTPAPGATFSGRPRSRNARCRAVCSHRDCLPVVHRHRCGELIDLGGDWPRHLSIGTHLPRRSVAPDLAHRHGNGNPGYPGIQVRGRPCGGEAGRGSSRRSQPAKRRPRPRSTI